MSLRAAARVVPAAALVALAALVAAAVAVPRRASADDAAPNAERLRSAASEYDAGRRAFGEKDYEGAATHFENAFHDAANASALRSAIRARRKAGQLARAATLATLAATRYPKDGPTMAVVQEILKEAQKKLHRIDLHCTPDCGVAADGRAISTQDSPALVFYLEPGDHELAVSWSSDRNKTGKRPAPPGGDDTLTFEAPPIPVKVEPVAVKPPPPPPAGAKPLGPIVFFTGVGLTVVSLAVTVGLGVDAENDPGASAVRRDCVGQGTSCPEYQQGLAAQTRTNAFLGTSLALGVATGVVGIFFTDWSRKDGKKAEKTSPPVQASFVPLRSGGAFMVGGAF